MRGKTVGACIKAVKGSKYAPHIMVVDGYSTDRTVEMARKVDAEVLFQERRISPGKGVIMKTTIRVDTISLFKNNKFPHEYRRIR